MKKNKAIHKGILALILCFISAIILFFRHALPIFAPVASPSPTASIPPLTEPPDMPAILSTSSPIPSPAPPLAVDTTAPVIEGVVPLTVSMGDSVSYRKNVIVSDDSGEHITLEIDNSQVILDEIGTYPVIYSAKDSAGNKARIETTLSVLEPSGVDVEYVISLADQLIAEQTTSDMLLWDKAYTLWNWCRKNIQYSYSAGSRSSVYAGAYEGLHDKRGDCYAYYATYSVLLDRLGVENLCVTREGGQGNHWWNLVNLGDGWYHCDASPRKLEHRYKCFMQTDAQLQEYQDFYVEHPGYYSFDASLYPEREKNIVFEGNPTSVRPTETSTPPLPLP